jgi:hypothetical protein
MQTKNKAAVLVSSWNKWLFPVLFVMILLVAAAVRLIGLTTFPPSLYWEEVALGYDAYSILKTGKDHHGHPIPIVAFESFGDYKPSLYFYALVPSIAIFGLSDFAVRFPSVIAGLLMVVACGLLARKVLADEDERKGQVIQLVAMAITALNPWAIQFSRGGWEVNLASCLVAWGVWFGLQAKKSRWWQNAAVSVVLLVLSMYCYHATRLIAPLLLISLGLYWLEKRMKSGKGKMWSVGHLKNIFTPLFALVTLAAILASPILLSLGHAQTSQRFAETSIFADGEAVRQANDLQEHFQPYWLGKILFHRYILMTAQAAQNYLLHFRFDFLFVSGDTNPRHSTQMFGLFYPFEAVFVLLGLLVLVRRRNVFSLLLGWWLFVGILPASLTQAAPHALRILATLPVWIVVITAGLCESYELIERYSYKVLKKFKLPLKSILAVAFVALYLLAFFAYWDFYSRAYAVRTQSDWQYGYKQVVRQLAKYNDGQTPVYFTREQGRPLMYYWFYTKTDPHQVQAADATAAKDQGEFLSFQNLHIIGTINEAKTGVITSSQAGFLQLQSAGHHLEVLADINDLSGKTVWVVYQMKD